MNSDSTNVASKEFVARMAMMMAVLALSIDGMLPALDQIGIDLGTKHPNDNQLVVSSIFLGMALGMMFFGPISDSFGRKRAVYLGMSIYLTGGIIALVSPNFTIMLIGRVLQGIGGSACRIVTMAMIRDKFVGAEMGRVMSLIMLVFIMVPAFAPSIGQFILLFSGWRAIFGFLFIYGLIGITWFRFRQSETLPISKRLSFSFQTIKSGIIETATHPIAFGYAMAAGAISGAFIGYLSSAQQILQIQYERGEAFSIYFGVLSIAFGVSTYTNSRLVKKIPMERLCLFALLFLSATSLLFFFFARAYEGHPPLPTMLGYIVVTFFCLGILFGSFNALAVQPLGHIAGVATSTIAFMQTLLSVGIGVTVGQLYNGTVLPLVLGYLICSTISLLLVARLQKSPLTNP
jgi:MFS transporter, DHA1 family, multidrug resistance protein